MADQQVAAAVEQVDREEVRGARHMGAAVAGHGGSSLSVVLAGGPYRWISKALSTLRHLNRSHRRRIDVAGAWGGKRQSLFHASLPGCLAYFGVCLKSDNFVPVRDVHIYSLEFAR